MVKSIVRHWRLVFLVIAALSFLVLGSFILWFATLNLPTLENFHTRRVPESTKIYDRTGQILLYDVHGNIRRTVVPLQDINPQVKNATIAIEDTEFYQHNGVRIKALLRAVWANIGGLGYAQGGSTITQQVVKNTLLSSEKTITRKVKEIILAIKIEKALTKDQILEIYLNESPYGGNIYGAEEASQYFFGKHAKDVTLAESAYLAALPQAPTYYSPYGGHKDALDKRKNLVLERMKVNNFINEEQYRAALNEKVVFTVIENNDGIKAPHFVFYIRDYLEEKYGAEAVLEGGYTVITSLDYDMQKEAEDIVRRQALANRKFNSENAALVAVDPQNGHILSMVGSRGYFDDEIDGKYNVTTARRQPGSTFKPFVYAAAFEKGFTSETVTYDLKTQFAAPCGPENFSEAPPCYSPDNYDGKFHGQVTLRQALAQSLNIPAVKTLYLAGLSNALSTARKMGISTLDKPASFYGSSLVLGGGEVTLLDLTSAYGTFANDGVRNPATGILKITSNKGEVLEEFTPKPVEVLEPGVARTISDILKDNVARAPSYGPRSYLYFPDQDVAVKTGTTNDFRDVWVVGYTPNLVVGTWAGNNDNRSIGKKLAGYILAPMWNEAMKALIKKRPVDTFNPMPALDPALPPALRGIAGENGVLHDVLHWVDKDNPREPRTSDPNTDPQYRQWEYPLFLWTNGSSSSSTLINSSGTIPTNGNTIGIDQNTGQSVGAFRITAPSSGSSVSPNGLMLVTVNNPGNALRNVKFYINNQFIGSSESAPFSLSYVPTAPGEMRLKAVGAGSFGQVADEVLVNVQ
jgi:1A family penicillin-binding protein